MSWPWRVGKKLGRTLYIGDKLVGVMDSPELATLVVDAVNEATRRRVAGDLRGTPCPHGEQSAGFCLKCRQAWDQARHDDDDPRATTLPSESLVNLRDRVERLEVFVKVLDRARTFGFSTSIDRALVAFNEFGKKEAP